MSESIVPQVDIAKFNGETARQMADGARDALMTSQQDTFAYAAALEPLIAHTLRHWGLDEQGGWGGASGQASRDAKKVVRALIKAADAQRAAAAHFVAFNRLFSQLVDAPIETQKARMNQRTHQRLDY